MTKSNGTGPSPFRAGLVHGILSVVVFSGLAGAAALGIHVTGDANEAGPRHVVALFAPGNGQTTDLKTRFVNPAIMASTQSIAADQADEPNLGVPDPSLSSSVRTPTPSENEQARPRGIRINGRTVLPGQSLSQVEQGASTSETVAHVATPKAEPAAQPAINSHAQPFENPEGKPIITLVVGGLGTSYRHSLAAIDDLPSEVTLSFTPDASPALLRKAREQGHEVLVELPLEAHSTGRTRPHPNTLTVSATQDENASRLRATLQRKPGAYGVITHDGAKFVTDELATNAVMADIARRGLAFFQHPSLRRARFEADADTHDVPFATAKINIDTRVEAAAIETELLQLETAAIEDGASFGTGFAYPVTVDVVSAWAARLEDKGILLAPASAAAAARQRPVQTSQLAQPDVSTGRTP